jgi:hypothetical protein
MIGISRDNFIWIKHFLFTVSRTQPKFDLRKLLLKSRDVEGMMVKCKSVKFTEVGSYCTVFINHEMREGVTKLCVFFLYFLFILINVFCFVFFHREVVCGSMLNPEKPNPEYSMSL